MVNYCNNDDILDKVGVTTEEISVDMLNTLAQEATAEVDRILKTTCNPKEEFLIIKGNNKNSILLNKLPLMSVKQIRIDDQDIDLDNVEYSQFGDITLLKRSKIQYFYNHNDEKNVKIRYVYGWLEEDNKKKTINSVQKGDNVEIELDSVLLLNQNDWVRIRGIDGNEEWTQVKAINKDTNTITCDLLQDHPENSIVYQGIIPIIIKKLTSVIGAMMGATRMMGATYTFATNYSIPDYSVTKGVPYPHFVKVMDDLTKQRDQILSKLIPYPVFA